MEARVHIEQLTEAQILAAIRRNYDPDDDHVDFVVDEIAEDDATDSESDNESNYDEADESEDDDNDQSNEGDGNEDESNSENSESANVYYGRDNTEWNAAPVKRLRTTQQHSTTALHKVKLLRGQHLDTEEDCFKKIIDKQIINTIVKFTNVGLSTMHRDTIRNVLGENSDDETQSVPEPPEKTAKRRCYLCPTNLDRKIKQTCDSVRQMLQSGRTCKLNQLGIVLYLLKIFKTIFI